MASTMPWIQELPPEVLLRILRFASVRSILQLAQTSKAMNKFCRDDEVWRPIVLSIVKRWGRDPSQTTHAYEGGTWYDQAHFLVPLTQFLGHFVCLEPGTCILLRLSVVYQPLGPGRQDRQVHFQNNLSAPSSVKCSSLKKHSVVVVAERLWTTNDVAPRMQRRSLPIPPNAIVDANLTSYYLPATRPERYAPRIESDGMLTLPPETTLRNYMISPDTGKTVDVLHLKTRVSPLFYFHERHGGVWPREQGASSQTQSSRLNPLRRTNTARPLRITLRSGQFNAALIPEGLVDYVARGVPDYYDGNGSPALVKLSDKCVRIFDILAKTASSSSFSSLSQSRGYHLRIQETPRDPIPGTTDAQSPQNEHSPKTPPDEEPVETPVTTPVAKRSFQPMFYSPSSLLASPEIDKLSIDTPSSPRGSPTSSPAPLMRTELHRQTDIQVPNFVVLQLPGGTTKDEDHDAQSLLETSTASPSDSGNFKFRYRNLSASSMSPWHATLARTTTFSQEHVDYHLRMDGAFLAVSSPKKAEPSDDEYILDAKSEHPYIVPAQLLGLWYGTNNKGCLELCNIAFDNAKRCLVVHSLTREAADTDMRQGPIWTADVPHDHIPVVKAANLEHWMSLDAMPNWGVAQFAREVPQWSQGTLPAVIRLDDTSAQPGTAIFIAEPLHKGEIVDTIQLRDAHSNDGRTRAFRRLRV